MDVSIFKRTHLDKKGKIVKGQNCVCRDFWFPEEPEGVLFDFRKYQFIIVARTVSFKACEQSGLTGRCFCDKVLVHPAPILIRGALRDGARREVPRCLRDFQNMGGCIQRAQDCFRPCALFQPAAGAEAWPAKRRTPGVRWTSSRVYNACVGAPGT